MNHVKKRRNEGWQIESNEVRRDEADRIEVRL